MDLDGEGAFRILTEQGDAWFYKRNLSPLPIRDNGSERIEARFASVEVVASKPAVSLAPGQAQSWTSRATASLTSSLSKAPCAGSMTHGRKRTGKASVRFARSRISIPATRTSKFIDLNGDGHSDILISEHEVLRWHPSLAEEGFGSSEFVRKVFDEEQGPALVFADGAQSIYLADMSGDGLTDIVRVRNGEVCYWPNVGYGRFGAKVTMDDSPWIDQPGSV